MGTGLCRNIVSLVLRRLNLLRHRRVGYMADMRLTSGRLGNLDNRICGDNLRNHRTGFQKRLPVVAPGFFHPLLLVLDDRIVFTVEACTAVKFLDDIHGF